MSVRPRPNLYAYDLAAKREIAADADGGGAIKNGMAEFVAQEEMDREHRLLVVAGRSSTSPCTVDESPVRMVERFEIAADNVTTFAQRYPAAGEANAAGAPRGRPSAHRRAHLDRSRRGNRLLSRARELAARWQDARRSSAKAAINAGSICCSRTSSTGRRPRARAERDQRQLDRAESRTDLSGELPGIHLGLEPGRIPASLSVRSFRTAGPPPDGGRLVRR